MAKTGTIAVQTTELDPQGGVARTNAGLGIGLLAVVPGTGVVRAGGHVVAVVGTQATYHGNPNNPKAKGFNPKCGSAKITKGVSNVLVEGKAVAISGAAGVGSILTCGHFCFKPPESPPIYNILIGGIG
jgi:uncharacterized Zn-binding protein involved in type VI secretion